MDLIRHIRSAPSNLAAAVAVALLLGACSSTAEPATLEDLGLAIAADIQQGSFFEVAVPIVTGTDIAVGTAPSGVEAAISPSSDGASLLLTLDVDPDTPSGTYNLGLVVTRDGQRQELGWPFDVVQRDVVVPIGGVDPGSPEALRDALVEALLLEDPDLVRALWPDASWDSLGSTIVGEFMPRSDGGACERTGEDGAHCFVFEEDDPFVLGLTMERAGLDEWVITTVGYDSTN